MSAAEFKYVPYSRRSIWPSAGGIGRAVAYLGVPASLATGGVLSSVNILTSFYLVAICGLVAVLRGTQVPSGLVAIGYFLLAWYVVLLGIDLLHGGPFGYPLFGVNYLASYFVLLAFPFFAIGLRAIKAEFRMFEYAMMATVLLAVGLSLYQFLFLNAPRPAGINSNPILFAMIVLMWCLFLLSRALATPKIDWLKFAVALAGLIPILLSASKLVWICGVLGYASLFVWWAWAGRRWQTLAAVIAGSIPACWLLYQMNFVQSRVNGFVAEVAALFATGDTSGGSFGLRYAAAASGISAFLDRPFLGYGLAEVKAAALEHRPPGRGNFAVLEHLHSEYVTDLVAFGIPGLLFVLSLFAVFFLVASRSADVAVRRFGFVSGAMFMVYMMAEVVFRWPEIYGLLFFLFGVVFLSVERDEFRLTLRRAATGVPGR